MAIIGDRLGEPDEFFYVRLTNASGVKIAKARGTVTIVDDEPRLNVSAERVNEGGAATFYFYLSATLDVPVSVNYATADGSAIAGEGDYVATSGTVTFAPGETTKTVTVHTLLDARSASTTRHSRFKSPG